jgi:hypothetical protein
MLSVLLLVVRAAVLAHADLSALRTVDALQPSLNADADVDLQILGLRRRLALRARDESCGGHHAASIHR